MVRQLLLRLAVAAVTILAASSGAFAQTSAPVTVRFAYAPSDDLLPFWYAQSTGMFVKAGLNVEVQSASSGAIVTQAVLSGAADIGRSSPQAIIAAHIRGIPVVIVAPGAIHRNGVQGNAAIAIAANSQFKNVLDLQGKTVACTAIGDVGYLGLRALIDAAGGDSSTVKWIELPIPTVAAALDQGRIDAGLTTEPFMTRDLAANKIKLLVDMLNGYKGAIVQGVYFAMKPYTAANADAVTRFTRVVDQAAAYTNTHPNETLDLLVKNTGIEPEVAAKMRRTTLALSWDPSQVQPLIDVAAKYKSIPQSFDARDLYWTTSK
jgi:NitT/TauT family transport system substrate-binding protein